MKPISGFDPSKSLTLVRNPNHDQATDDTRANYVDGITVTIDTNIDDIFSRVAAGDLDSSINDQPPKPVLQQYLTDPAKKPFLHSNDGDRTWYITMNWATPPFDDLPRPQGGQLDHGQGRILQACQGGTTFGDIATHNIPPIVMGGLLPPGECDPYASEGNKGDEAKAKEEMKQSKYDTNKDEGLRRHGVLQPGHDQPQRDPMDRRRGGRRLQPRQDRHQGEAAPSWPPAPPTPLIQTVKNKIRSR